MDKINHKNLNLEKGLSESGRFSVQSSHDLIQVSLFVFSGYIMLLFAEVLIYFPYTNFTSRLVDKILDRYHG